MIQFIELEVLFCSMLHIIQITCLTFFKWVIFILCKKEHFFPAISWLEQVTFQW